jgi:hypothetical protein
VVNGAFNRIGSDLDGLAARNSMQGDRQLGNDLHDAARHYQELVPESQRAPIIDNTIREIGEAVANNGGSLPGDAYSALRSRLSRAARSSNDPQLSHALSDLTESLDEAMSRSIRNSNPSDAGGFEQARRQYRNMMVVERAVTGAGKDAADGVITPSALRSATKAVMGRRALARGEGDFRPGERGAVRAYTAGKQVGLAGLASPLCADRLVGRRRCGRGRDRGAGRARCGRCSGRRSAGRRRARSAISASPRLPQEPVDRPPASIAGNVAGAGDYPAWPVERRRR